MEPIIVALICAASFGGVVAIAAFVRQIILSKDKLLNEIRLNNMITSRKERIAVQPRQLQTYLNNYWMN